ncbi:protein STRUBBELIG-RECEPTOR FAMILY 8 isoform X1 [Elaeis guineensis]|uniref:Protein STRUBBELIG-RECEPTOR FAMILY 8 isoform X1 n=1 Tax=Elaeis guineensis var. tenera TaxID=51953 RepID=A0A6I9SI54_ELAGV|nr:protein STRUBBELIG-RECEPTOR FAMILY 8 isoform X1 [Elaeis guineensis]XP_019701520.1 protein STRUBBELIG-RECEPTOR FAMILY 8 isoform X1 [Elaeis guineensis]
MGGLRERRLLSDHPRPMHRSMAALAALAVLAVFFGSLAVVGVESATDPFDVQALGVLYSSLNSPPQLSGWTWSGGDPCGDSWKGITCSGSAVTAMQVSGMGLNGTLGYLLSDLLSLKTLDMSNNSIHDGIPYQLPPNLTYLNLANNNLSGNLPYSIYTMVSLNYLNLSHNSLSQQIGDIFANLQDLSELDLSFNNLTGDLPNSLSSLSHLSSLYLQENQLTGPVNLLANLDLTTLNIADNNFSGWMPQEFSSIPNLITGGNTFANGPAPPPPPYVPPPPSRPHKNRNHTKAPTDTPQGPESKPFHPDNENNKKSLTAGSVTGIVIGSTLGALCIVVAVIFYLWNVPKKKDDTRNSTSPYLASATLGEDRATDKEMREQRLKTASVTSLKPLPAEKMMVEKVYGKNGSGKRPKVPITATSHTIASLQIATNSFSQDSLVGEGSLGRVYRAEISNGKVLAVKKIDSAALSLQEEDNFLEAVSNMSRLRHPNIVSLVGYCVEHGQRLLVYEYIGNRTLHDMLHYADDSSNKLTWNARVRVALGTARALEYLHEVCLPSLVHRNFKSANILLDEELNPHLSDCGLAALTPNTERQVSTEMVGSFGYSAPEFAMSGVYTVKSDVYSFGIVMLELLTGRKPLDSSRERSEQSLVRWATPQLHDIDALAKMVDPALNGIYPAKSLSRFADVIALCVQPEPEFRPPMSEVVQQLVRLMQRASIVRRSSGDELGYSYRVPEHEVSMTDLSF